MHSNKHLVALVMAIGVSIWLILMGVNIIFQDFPISDQLSTLLSTSLGATVGALAVYLGGRDQHETFELHDDREFPKTTNKPAEQKDEGS